MRALLPVSVFLSHCTEIIQMKADYQAKGIRIISLQIRNCHVVLAYCANFTSLHGFIHIHFSPLLRCNYTEVSCAAMQKYFHSLVE